MAVSPRRATRKSRPSSPRCFFGLETEYSVHVRKLGHRHADEVRDDQLMAVGPDLLTEVARIGRGWVDSGLEPPVWLPNGGMFYLDIGSHPEYAGPETSDPAECARQNRIGDLLISAAARNLNEVDRRRNRSGSAGFDDPLVRMIMKSTVDAHDNTFGAHENYLTSSGFNVEQAAPLLGSFLASRIVYTGLGGIQYIGGRWQYRVSPRARHIQQLTSLETTKRRGLVNLRFEPHADSDQFARLHLICGDANRCDIATYLKVGTTAIVVAMLQDQRRIARDIPLRALTFKDPVGALHETSRLDGHFTEHPMKVGRLMHAIDHQRRFAEYAARYVERFGGSLFSREETAGEVVDLWRTVLDELADDPMRTAGKLDWTTKLGALREVSERHGVSVTDFGQDVLRGFDLRWGEVGDPSIVSIFERGGHIECLGTPGDAHAITPPTDSRAALRGFMVSRHPDIVKDMNWAVIAVSGRDSPAKIGCIIDRVDAFDSETIASSGLADMDVDALRLHFALHTVERMGHFATAPMEPSVASALLSCTKGAAPAAREVIANAVASGTRNELRRLASEGVARPRKTSAQAAMRKLTEDVRDIPEIFFAAAAQATDPGRQVHALHAMIVEEDQRVAESGFDSERFRSRLDVINILTSLAESQSATVNTVRHEDSRAI